MVEYNCHQKEAKNEEGGILKTIGDGLKSQNLIHIKQIVTKDKNGDRFTIVRTKKNVDFMRNYNLNHEDVKDIVKGLSIEDCFSGPEMDRDSKYKGMIFKFNPIFENIKLYIKIRIENKDNAICISVHEFGKYDEGD